MYSVTLRISNGLTVTNKETAFPSSEGVRAWLEPEMRRPTFCEGTLARNGEIIATLRHEDTAIHDGWACASNGKQGWLKSVHRLVYWESPTGSRETLFDLVLHWSVQSS